MSSGHTLVVTAALPREPEAKYTQGGTFLLKFALPLESRRLEDGQWQTDTTWLNVVEFGKTAEGHSKILHKGSIVQVSGQLEPPKISDDGSRVWLNLVARDVQPIANFGKAKQDAARDDDGELPI